MKKLISLILALVLGIAALSSCQKADVDIPDGYQLASNEVCDFDFFVPETWKLSLSDGTVAAYCSPSDPTSISVMPGELEHTDTTVDDWWADYQTDFTGTFDEFTVISQTDATLGGAPGKCYSFTAKLGENSYRFEITAVIYQARLYMLTFTSIDSMYENHTETLADVKEFFKFH